MQVSVVVRTKDRPLLLKRCLENLTEQGFSDFEVLIVDDGSKTESAAELATQFAARLNLRLLRHATTLGRSAALNTGLTGASAELVCIHDDDDLWDRAFLEATLSTYRARREGHARCVGAVSHVARRYERLEGTGFRIVREEAMDSACRPKGLVQAARYLLYSEDIYPIQALFERSAALDAGPIPPGLLLFEDRYLFSRMLMAGDFAVVPQILAFQHLRVGAEALQMSDVDKAEIDLHFAALQNDLLRCSSATPGSQALALAPLMLELRRSFEKRQKAGYIRRSLRRLLARRFSAGGRGADPSGGQG